MLPFDFNRFEELYDLRMVLETTAAHRLCEGAHKVDAAKLDELVAIWLVSPEQRSTDMRIRCMKPGRAARRPCGSLPLLWREHRRSSVYWTGRTEAVRLGAAS